MLACIRFLLWLILRSLAWHGVQMESSWPQRAKMGKFASLTPASPQHPCRYVRRADRSERTQQNDCWWLLILSNTAAVTSFSGGPRSWGPQRSSCGVGVWGQIPAGVRIWQVMIRQTIYCSMGSVCSVWRISHCWLRPQSQWERTLPVLRWLPALWSHSQHHGRRLPLYSHSFLRPRHKRGHRHRKSEEIERGVTFQLSFTKNRCQSTKKWKTVGLFCRGIPECSYMR